MIICKIYSVYEIIINKLFSNSENFYGIGFWDIFFWIFIKGIFSDFVGNNFNISFMV